MPPRAPEDILQLIPGLVTGGIREHRELTVSTVYDPATNGMSFAAPRRHVRVFSEEDVFWIDSAESDADAQAKLIVEGARGFIRGGDRLEVSLSEGVTRLDFLARNTAGGVFVTGLA